VTKEIISRDEAKEQGLKRYFTGEACKHGHFSSFYVKTQKCCECERLRAREYYERNAEKRREYSKQYRKDNPEKVSEANKKYSESNKEYLKKLKKEYRKRNKEKISEYNKEYREKNIEYSLRRSREYYNENKESVSKQRKEYYKKNREKLIQYTKDYYKENREAIIEKQKVYYQENKEDYKIKARERYNTNTNRRLAYFMRRCVKNSIIYKTSSTFQYLDYKPEDLKKHLESQFEPGMSWENYGVHGWHVDHIIPIDYYLKNGITDPAIINALDNLRPLWASENLSKGAKYDPEDSS
jgi:hypothetical protein